MLPSIMNQSRISRNFSEINISENLRFSTKTHAKKYLILVNYLKIVLNINSECILCVMGFQMTYRTCSHDYYSLLNIYSNHTLKNDW